MYIEFDFAPQLTYEANLEMEALDSWYQIMDGSSVRNTRLDAGQRPARSFFVSVMHCWPQDST